MQRVPAEATVQTPSVDDFALMRSIAARDQAALAALYDRHAGIVFALCTRILGDRGEAEDVL